MYTLCESMLGAWMAVAMVLVTAMAVVINYLFFRSQADPYVVVYADVDEHRPTIINLIIENIGRSMAENVRFSTSAPLPAKVFGTTDSVAKAQILSEGPLIHGIPALGPGAKRVITWGRYPALYSVLGDDVIRVRIEFEARAWVPWDSTERVVICPIEVQSFFGTDGSDSNWSRRTALATERIAECLEKRC